MSKLIILGAGASYGCSCANSMKIPLLKDLHKVVPNTHNHYQERDEQLIKDFNELYVYSGVDNDFEMYCTALFYIEKARVKIEPKYVFFQEETLKMILSMPQYIYNFTTDISYYPIVHNILTYAQTHRELAEQYIAYTNFQTLFADDFYNYMFLALGHNRHCIYHEKLFQMLSQEDTVISFNYDEIADYTLLNMEKLDERSFSNLGFKGVYIAKKYPHSDPVRLIKLHGSLNWFYNMYRQDVYYNLLVDGLPSPDNDGVSPHILIYPVKDKEEIYYESSILTTHLTAFNDSLSLSSEIWLVGKTFMNNDSELSTRIKSACSSGHRKELNIIDPCVKDSAFIEYHTDLFNAEINRTWSTLENYYNNSYCQQEAGEGGGRSTR